MELTYHFIKLDRDNSSDFLPLCRTGALESAMAPGAHAVATGVLDQEELPIAVAIAEVKPPLLHLTSLMVAPEHRNRGLGTKLLRATMNAGFKLGCTAVCGTYSMPEHIALETFLLDWDFTTDNTGALLYRCSTQELRQGLAHTAMPPLRGKLSSVRDLPLDLRADPRQPTGKGAPIAALNKLFPGHPLPQANVACVRDGTVVGFTLCSAMSGGEAAALNQLYLAPGADDVGLPLLTATLARLCKTDAQYFSFAAGSDGEQQLMEQLGNMLDIKWEKKVYHTAHYERIRPIPPEPENDMDVLLTYLVPRLNGLHYLLENLEPSFPSRLILSADRLPYLLVTAQDSPPIQLNYVPMENYWESDRYLLMAVTRLALPQELSAQEARTRCQLYNDYTSGGPLATYNEAEHTIQLRATLPESGGLSEPDVIHFFLDVLLSGVDELLSEEPAEAPPMP